MGELAGAYASTTKGTYEKTQLTINKTGRFPAYFLGCSETWTETSTRYQCSKCGGNGTGPPPRHEPGQCTGCNGNGRKIDEKTKLRFEMRHGIEEEVVTYKLTSSGVTAKGKSIKPSTMYLRFRGLADIPNATAEVLDHWYTTLAKPRRVPCWITIGRSDTNDGFVIKDVEPREAPHANGHAREAVQNGSGSHPPGMPHDYGRETYEAPARARETARAPVATEAPKAEAWSADSDDYADGSDEPF